MNFYEAQKAYDNQLPEDDDYQEYLIEKRDEEITEIIKFIQNDIVLEGLMRQIESNIEEEFPLLKDSEISLAIYEALISVTKRMEL